MGNAYQKTTIIGYVGGDAKLAYTKNGTAVSNFWVAINESWKDKNGDKTDKTTWYKVTCWRNLAEITSEYVKKGMLVFVEGIASTEAYMIDGKIASANLVLTAQTVLFLSKANTDSSSDLGNISFTEENNSDMDEPEF